MITVLEPVVRDRMAGACEETAPSTRTPRAVDFSRPVVCILGLPFDMVGLAAAVQAVRDAARVRRPLFISTANLNFVITAMRDLPFRQSVLNSQLSLADGMPIVWIARLLRLPLRERVAGSGLFEQLCQRPAQPRLKVYFFGAQDGVAEAASERVNREAVGVRCVGFDNPGFCDVEAMSTPPHIERINHSGADFVVVSLGAQKGQAWIERNRAAITAPVISHLGAVVGFAAGALRRAPGAMQRLGLEWLWRIKEEPQLWRRYARDGLLLLRLLVHSVLPLWWLRRSPPPRPSEPCSARPAADDGFELHLGSALTRETLDLARPLFAAAATARSRVVVDLRGTEAIDPFGMGWLLLLYGHQRAIGKPLAFRHVSPAMARLFRWNCASYVLGPWADADLPQRAPDYANPQPQGSHG